ncbi:MAG: hypothetical protein QRY72_01785 [Candidatus Rhabdochlamydia sp.]
MPIQYSPGAAGLSWLALAQALENRAKMQGSLLDLFSSNMQFMIETSENQSTADMQVGQDNANQLVAQGTSALAGAAAGAFLTVGGSTLSQKYASQADNIQLNSLNDSEEGDMNVQLESVDPQSPVVEMDIAPQSSQNPETAAPSQKPAPSNPSTSAAEEPAASSSSCEKKLTDTTMNPNAKEPVEAPQIDKTIQNKKTLNLSAEDDIQVKALYRKSELLSNTSSSSSQIVSSLGSASGQIASINSAIDQGKQNALKDMAQGLSSIFNNETSQMSAAISSCDNFMQNTNGIISALIQASSSRA